jgi:hypothetical protein
VAYSLKARTVESQQPDVAKQRPVNNNRGIFLVLLVPMAAHATLEYVMPPLSNRFTYRGMVFSTRSGPRCYNQVK